MNRIIPFYFAHHSKGLNITQYIRPDCIHSLNIFNRDDNRWCLRLIMNSDPYLNYHPDRIIVREYSTYDDARVEYNTLSRML